MSGAPSTASEATEPANIPISKPRSAAIRAEMASCTEAGCTQALPPRISRNRARRPLQREAMLGPPCGFRPVPKAPDRALPLQIARRRRLCWRQPQGKAAMREEQQYAVLHEFLAPAQANLSRA